MLPRAGRQEQKTRFGSLSAFLRNIEARIAIYVENGVRLGTRATAICLQAHDSWQCVDVRPRTCMTLDVESDVIDSCVMSDQLLS